MAVVPLAQTHRLLAAASLEERPSPLPRCRHAPAHPTPAHPPTCLLPARPPATVYGHRSDAQDVPQHAARTAVWSVAWVEVGLFAITLTVVLLDCFRPRKRRTAEADDSKKGALLCWAGGVHGLAGRHEPRRCFHCQRGGSWAGTSVVARQGRRPQRP